MSQHFGPIAHVGLPFHDEGRATQAPQFARANHRRRRLHLDLRRSLQLHRRLVLTAAGLGLTVAVAYLAAFWSSYTAQSVVYVQPAPVLGGGSPISWPYGYDGASYESYLQQQIFLMTRADVLTGAVHKLPAGVWQLRGESDERATERLRGALDVARIGNSYQVSITAHATDAKSAAALANAVAASYLEETAHEQISGDTDHLAMLRDERDRVKKQLDDDRAEEPLKDEGSSATAGSQAASDLAGEIARLQNQYSALNAQIENPAQALDAPAARLAAAATVPLHPENFAVIRNAAALFFGFALLGMIAAVIAHKADPLVYVSSDVENLLGFAPMAQLPDFSEVSEEVADEHLLRLAAEIDFACGEGRLHSCIFTGTGPGVGTTTIANRVRNLLETMGRHAVVVDAKGPVRAAHDDPSFERRIDEVLTEAFGVPEIQLAIAPEDATGEAARDRLVLTDTAPISVSAETEYLARFADCAMVVIASGQTTRAQLSRVAEFLQRVNPRTVGFVLNRVGLNKADGEFRRSIEEMERHRRVQGRSQTWQTIRSKYFMADAVRTAAAQGSLPQGDAAADAVRPSSRNGNTDTQAAPAEARATGNAAVQNNWDPDNIPPWLTDAMARIEEAHAKGRKLPLGAEGHEPQAEPAGEITAAEPAIDSATGQEAAAEPDTVEKEPSPEEKSTDRNGLHAQGADSMLKPVEWIVGNPPRLNTGTNGTAGHSAQADPAQDPSSRLSRLRGIVSANSLKELEETRQSAADAHDAVKNGNGNGNGYSAPERLNGNGNGSKLSALRGLASEESLKELRRAPHRMPLRGDVAQAEESVTGRETRSAEQPATETKEPARSIFSEALPDSSLTGPGGTREPFDESFSGEAGMVSAQMQTARRRIRNLPLEEVQILPARRGQYRKKD